MFLLIRLLVLVASSRTAGHLHQPLAPAFQAALATQKAQKTVFLLRSACASDVACVDNPQHDWAVANSDNSVTS